MPFPESHFAHKIVRIKQIILLPQGDTMLVGQTG